MIHISRSNKSNAKNINIINCNNNKQITLESMKNQSGNDIPISYSLMCEYAIKQWVFLKKYDDYIFCTNSNVIIYY